MTYAAEEDSIPLCYFNYNNNAFHLYFLYCDILYHSNKYISLIFASSCVLIFTFVWPLPQPAGTASTFGKLDAKMQILLHLKRFTKSRVCIRDTDSPSRDLEGMNKTAKNGTDTRKKGTRPWKRKTICKQKVLDMTKTPMGRLLLERRSRLSNFYPVSISGSLKIVLWVLCFTSTYRQFHAVKVWGCKKVGYYAKSPRRDGHYQSDDVVDERGEAGDDPDEEEN